jgi:diguanylate cyclase (GGDEF)-like protein
VGRWGGEEFLIICPETCKDEAYPLADKLQKKVAGLRFQDAEAITGSFGLAQLGAKEGIEDLIRRVDQALYQAKDAGKNQVICLL